MTPERWQRIKQLFDDVLPLEPGQRAAALESASSVDPESVEMVLKLLEGAESSGSFLERPVGNARKMLSDVAREQSRPRLEDGRRLGDRFQIMRFVAHGGMGEVYEAFDSELAIRVAIKTLRPEYARDRDLVDRFRREVQLARDVGGDHLCRIYDIGRDGAGEDEVVYLSMEFLDGPTLRQVIRDEGAMPLERAAELLTQVAQGLDSLREAGIVHRDLKPGNIMLVGWGGAEVRVVITDFGLARGINASAGGAGQSTASGRLAGTPEYMAPEQLAGKAVSPATDVYAFGLVAYEVIAGVRPFGEASGWEAAYRRLTEAPESPRTHLPTLPGAWERAILRCLSAEPSTRPSSAMLVTKVLRGELPESSLYSAEAVSGKRRSLWDWRLLVAAMVCVVVLAGAGWFVWQRPNVAAPATPAEVMQGKHLAVLPFSSPEDDERLKPYAAGLMDAIARRLSQFEQSDQQLMVVPASEVRSQQAQTPGDALRLFGVDYAVEGAVEAQGDRVRLTLSVVDPKRMRQIETVLIEEPRSRLLNLQDGAVAKLSNVLDLRVNPARASEVASAISLSPDAYDYFLQGRGYLQRVDRKEDIEMAAQLFQRALKADESYAPAMAGLAEAYWYLFDQTREPRWVDEAKQWAEKALNANAQIAESHITMGRILNGTGKYKEAVASFERALELDRRNPEALDGLSVAYTRLGDYPLAEGTLLRAVSLRPGDWRMYKQLGVYYYRRGEYKKAAEPFQHVVELTPDNAQGYNNLGAIYLYLGEYDLARENLRRTIQLKPRASAYQNLATAEFSSGNYEEALVWYRKALSLDERSYRAWGNIGTTLRKLKRVEESEAALEEAMRILDAEIKVNPKEGGLYSYLAHFQAMRGDGANAQANMRRSEDLQGDDPDLLMRNADTWVTLNNRQKAKDTMQKAIEKGFVVDSISRFPTLKELYAEILKERSE